MKRFLLIFTAFLTLSSVSFSQTVGLVLSGGGAKGIAHIGIIQALEENNVPIDYIAGTSMGAIVGALYAMGYTPAEMIELIKSDDFASWSTGKMEEKYIYYFKKPDQTPEFASFKIGLKDSSKITPHFLPKSLINPLPMNLAFMRIFAPYTAQSGGNFNNLFVPFRAVASDVYHKRPVIFEKGDLGDAVRASMSFPFVFKPIEIDSVLLYDGGIYNNFPIDVMKKDFNPDIIIGSNVSSNPEKPKEDNLMAQIENMVMQKTDYKIKEEDGILIDFNLKEYNLLDFPKADQIFKIGYDKAVSMMDSIKSRIPRELPSETRKLQRMVFKSKTPELLFEDISIKGGNHSQQNYIRKQFQLDENKLLDQEDVKQSYYKLLSDSKISDLIPHAVYDEESGNFKLLLNAKLEDNIAIGLGGYISSGNTNQIYLGAKYRTLSLYSLDFDYFELLSIKTADMTVGDSPTITVKKREISQEELESGEDVLLTERTRQSEENLKTLCERTGLYNKLTPIVIDMSRYGDAVARIYTQNKQGTESNNFTVVSPELWFPIVDREVKENRLYDVLAWTECLNPEAEEKSLPRNLGAVW